MAAVSRTTVQRDVECFVRTYESRVLATTKLLRSHLRACCRSWVCFGHSEANFSSCVERSAHYRTRFSRTRSTASGNGLGGPKTLSLEAIAFEPGSPGRVFLLDQDDLVERLSSLGEVTHGDFSGPKPRVFDRYFGRIQ